MMNKNFFADKKDLIEEESKKFKTHSETKEFNFAKCDHMGKVKAVPGGARCICGTGWAGGQINVILEHYKSVV